MKRWAGILLIISFFSSAANGQETNQIILTSRLDYYTSETRGELIVYIPGSLFREGSTFSAAHGFRYLIKDYPLRQGLNLAPFNLSLLPRGIHRLVCSLRGQDGNSDLLDVTVIKRRSKSNAVKIDRATGGLSVEGRPYFPFGFYCYSPVQPTLAEEEVVLGFNMMSPYQHIDRRGRRARHRYMDRCAELGMKVHFNLLSVAGGGGVGNYRYSQREVVSKTKLLTEEVLAFRDHPALLAWYISDEPTGHDKAPEDILDTYRLIKALDPFHPVSIVFMNPKRAEEYKEVMDLVMADPYPVPNRSIKEVGNIAAKLKRVFAYQKPVWIVPQAFGGNEWWPREPTRQELRVMTYLALINGATGIQYFIRHGRNAFPKSTVAWAEAGALSRETAQIAPFLLSSQTPEDLSSRTEEISVGTWTLGPDKLILAANTRNIPVDLQIEGASLKEITRIGVLFENRTVSVEKGILQDMIDAFGTRAYLVEGPVPKHQNPGLNPGLSPPEEKLSAVDAGHSGSPDDSENLILNPGFEDNPSAGTPAGCYVRLGKDRGATYFVDSLVPYQGRYSLRLNTPGPGEGVTISFFPVTLKRGRRYRISLWARTQSRGILEKRSLSSGFLHRNFPFLETRLKAPKFRISLGGALSKDFAVSASWRPFSATVFIPAGKDDSVRLNPTLTLLSTGTAWFDDMELVEDNSSYLEGSDF